MTVLNLKSGNSTQSRVGYFVFAQARHREFRIGPCRAMLAKDVTSNLYYWKEQASNASRGYEFVSREAAREAIDDRGGACGSWQLSSVDLTTVEIVAVRFTETRTAEIVKE